MVALPSVAVTSPVTVALFVAVMAAFDAHYNHGLFPSVEEALQTPTASIGGVFVVEKVVPVKEVRYG